jgi:hypothetical protein
VSTHPVQYDRDLMVCRSCRLALVVDDYEQTRAGSAEVITVGDRLDGRRETYVALWRFVTDHAEHDITTVCEGDTHFADGLPIEADLRLVEFSAAALFKAPDDLTVRQYVRGWPDQPQHPMVSGPRHYTTLHPQPEPSPIAGVEDERATRRLGIPAAPTLDRPLHVPGWIRPPWLDYFLHYSNSLQGWVLAAVSTVGNAVRHVELDYDDHLGRWFAGTAQDWARHYLETGVDEHDLRPAGVTEWRAVVYDDRQGWTPLFDTTDPGRLPWTDLAATTGARHHQRLGTAARTAGIAGPATASDR